MKKVTTIYLLIFTLYSSVGKSQQYVPLVVDSAHWIIEQCDYGALPPTGYAREYFILGDTTLNSVQYKKVYMRGWEFEFCNLGQPSSPYQLFSFIREDTLNKKVYSTGGGDACPSGNDTLIYDFDLHVGDTTNTCITGWETIASITQGNSWYSSKTFKTDNNYDLFEGVGSQFGLFETLEFTVSGGGNPWLTYYCRGDLSNCGLTVSIENHSNSINKLHLYPNPTIDILIIEHNLGNSEKLIVEVHNITGEKILSTSLSTKIMKLDVSNFSQGLYIVHIKDNQKIINTQKWLKVE